MEVDAVLVLQGVVHAAIGKADDHGEFVLYGPAPGYDRVTLRNSPSKVAAAAQPFSHFISTDAVVGARSFACAAPLTTKVARAASGMSHRSSGPDRITLQPNRLRRIRFAPWIAYDLSAPDAEFATSIRDVLGVIGESLGALPKQFVEFADSRRVVTRAQPSSDGKYTSARPCRCDW
jgi:hypothetical protein